MTTKRTGITLKEVFEQRGLNRSTGYYHAMSKAFPDPEFVMGNVKVYDPRKVDRYFAEREQRRRSA